MDRSREERPARSSHKRSAQRPAQRQPPSTRRRMHASMIPSQSFLWFYLYSDGDYQAGTHSPYVLRLSCSVSRLSQTNLKSAESAQENRIHREDRTRPTRKGDRQPV